MTFDKKMKLQSYGNHNYLNKWKIKMNLNINLIVAVDTNWGISKNTSIPWHIKEDMNLFQDVTKRSYEPKKYNAVIMGKNTWKLLPVPFRGLRDRINIVISTTMSSDELNEDNTTKSESYVVKSLEEALDLCNKLQPGKVFIGGGINIYKEALQKFNINEIYLTQIKGNYDCDNIFPYELLNSLLPEYKIHSKKVFHCIDHNITEKNRIETTFTKFYKGEIPIQFNNNTEEENYLKMLEDVLSTGHFRKTRNSNTWSKFGKTLEFDLSNGIPVLSTKKIFIRGIFEELLFFLKGDTNVKHLSDKNVNIWNANTSREFLDSIGLNHYEPNTMGPMYGYNWRFYGEPYKGPDHNYSGGFDQIKYCLDLIKNDPFSRRILLTTFNPSIAKEGVLYPCHSLINQFYVEENNKLSMSCYNRSQDAFLGYPFNLTMSSLLVNMFCEVINNDETYKGPKLIPGRLIMNLGDVHIYENHYEQCVRQILRDSFKFPKLIFSEKITNLTDFKFEDLQLVDYNCYPSIIAKMVA